MKLNLLWMYHDVMELYGDKGNIASLKKRCEDRNIELIIDTCTLNEEKVLKEYDILFIGGGPDKEQSILLEDLLKRKNDIIEAMHHNTFILLICGGYQLFGKYYKNSKNEVINGLGLFDYYTESGSKRCTGNIAIEVDLEGTKVKVVGFENHGGQSKNVSTPWGKVLYGHGNDYDSSFEGFYQNNVLGTYIHGPLLPKNPEVADFIIKKGLERKYKEVSLTKLDDSLELKAKEVILKKMNLL